MELKASSHDHEGHVGSHETVVFVLTDAAANGNQVEEIPGDANFGPPIEYTVQRYPDCNDQETAHILMSTSRRRGLRVAPTGGVEEFSVIKEHQNQNCTH